ncbi:CotH kinase family protein [Paenibacillus flagellatus]|uniref:Spore coat protein CotH n=1 Tax=Paenibacillus flagellatus TaxID=2211139 RepID=A0A2V5JYW4_9BACL|nr:CotH kinase family protein [Paenibacillus flagellatus]PYI52095.1 spore coat protein CotH [Paenibacillus flagellatus]
MALAEYDIVIGAYERKLMQKHIWDGTFVKAQLLYEGKKVPIRVRYRGGHTRDYPKKSYEIRVGNKTYHFNAEYDDPSMMRNALSFQFLETIGVPSPFTRHCVLHINGRSEGVYLLIEAVNRAYFRRRKIAVRSLVYASNDSANFSLISPETGRRKRTLFEGYRLVIGKAAARTRLKRFIRSIHRLRGAKLSRYLNRKLDIDNYLRWLAGAVLTGNYDGFDQNYALYEHAPTGKYRIVPWDYEGTWGRNCYGRRCASDIVRITGYNALTEALLSDKTVRGRYRELMRALLRTAFTESRIMPMVNRMHSRIAPSIYNDDTRKWPLRVFDSEPELIRDYIRERRDILLKELEDM